MHTRQLTNDCNRAAWMCAITTMRAREKLFWASSTPKLAWKQLKTCRNLQLRLAGGLRAAMLAECEKDRETAWFRKSRSHHQFYCRRTMTIFQGRCRFITWPACTPAITDVQLFFLHPRVWAGPGGIFAQFRNGGAGAF